MRIEHLMTKIPKACQPGHNLSEAAQMMWDNDCGCLPVTAGDGSQRLVGMITDRDICMAIRGKAGSPRELRVVDAMTKSVRACNPRDPLSEAAAIMAEARVRRLPVVGDYDQVVGLISQADLALEAVRQTASRSPEISLSEIGELQATICQPASRGSDKPPTGRSIRSPGPSTPRPA